MTMLSGSAKGPRWSFSSPLAGKGDTNPLYPLPLHPSELTSILLTDPAARRLTVDTFSPVLLYVVVVVFLQFALVKKKKKRLYRYI